MLTELSWRLVFLLPALLALVAALAATQLVPVHGAPTRDGRRFDLASAVGVTAVTTPLPWDLLIAGNAAILHA